MGRPRYGYGYGYARSGDAPINPSTILGTSLSAWFDPSDLGTMWQDTAATTPAVVGSPVARQTCKRNPAFYRQQSTLAQRPILGRMPKSGRRNKCENYNANPVDTTGMSKSGDAAATLTVVDDTAALAAAGLSGLCSSGKVYKLDNSAGSDTAYVYAAGDVGNTNPHTISAYARKTGVYGVLGGSGTGLGGTVNISSGGYTRVSYTGTPGATNVRLQFSAGAGAVVYFILNQLEEASTASAVQTVAGAYDCTEAPYSHCYYLQADGNDDFYTTPDLDLSTITSDGQARRNLLLYPEDFSASVWEKLVGGTGITPTVTPNNAIAPDGTVTAYTIVLNTGVGVTSSDVSYVNQFITTFVGSAVSSVWLKTTDGTTKTLGLRCGAPSESTITVTGEWQRFQVASVAATIDRIQILNRGNYSNASVSVDLWHPQLETGSTATDYQKIGTDKVAVFAGIRKLSDAASAMFVEFSANTNSNNGTFSLSAPPGAASPAFQFRSRGTIVGDAPATGYPAPYTAVVSGIGDISASSAIVRVNGVQATLITTSQGTGNYSNNPLYFYRRSGSMLPFKGMDFGCVLATGTLTSAQITAMERYIARNTPEVNL